MFSLWFPHLAQAAALDPLKQFIIKVEVVVLNPVIKLGFVIAFVVFLWGVFQFIKDGENSTERAKGAQHMLWGVIGIFIMIAAGGIINLICGSWGIPATECHSPFSF